jgi:hypothetical protein
MECKLQCAEIKIKKIYEYHVKESVVPLLKLLRPLSFGTQADRE